MPKSAMDNVKLYSDLIRYEQQRLQECLNNIQEYAAKLNKAAQEAQNA